MGVINYKTWYDVWEHKGRTLQVVLIIAIGAFAIGTASVLAATVLPAWRASKMVIVDALRHAS